MKMFYLLIVLDKNPANMYFLKNQKIELFEWHIYRFLVTKPFLHQN